MQMIKVSRTATATIVGTTTMAMAVWDDLLFSAKIKSKPIHDKRDNIRNKYNETTK
jgi:hypothetical protein